MAMLQGRGREGRPSEEQERSPQDATLRAEERQPTDTPTNRPSEPPEPPELSDPKPLRQDVAFTLQRGIGLLWSAGIEAAPDRIDQNAWLSLLREASPLLSPSSQPPPLPPHYGGNGRATHVRRIVESLAGSLRSLPHLATALSPAMGSKSARSGTKTRKPRPGCCFSLCIIRSPAQRYSSS